LGSPVNGPVQVMCGVIMAALGVALLSMGALMSGWFWDQPTVFRLGSAAVAALLMVWLGKAGHHAPAGGA